MSGPIPYFKFPPLYRKFLNGQIQVWRQEVHGHTIITTFGQLYEKMHVVKMEINKGKNRGRINGHHAACAAHHKAQDKWARKIFGGYYESLERAQAVKMSKIIQVSSSGENNGAK